MAKRELSTTLKNLKFMQRATQREEKANKEEEVVLDGNFLSSSAPKKCVVIMEGDPHPGAVKCRMSFLSFNPSIDKINEEASNFHQPEASATSSGRQSEVIANRENGSSRDELDNLERDSSSFATDGDVKRKQVDEVSKALYPNKSQKNIQDQQRSSSSSSRSSSKRSKREKLDWNVLRPPKGQNKK